MLRWARSLAAAALCCLLALTAASSSPPPAAAPSTGFTNNWAVLVCTVSHRSARGERRRRLTAPRTQSRYWFNYRVRNCTKVQLNVNQLTPDLALFAAHGEHASHVRKQGHRRDVLRLTCGGARTYLQVPHRETTRHSRLADHPHARRRCGLQPAEPIRRYRLLERRSQARRDWLPRLLHHLFYGDRQHVPIATA